MSGIDAQNFLVYLNESRTNIASDLTNRVFGDLSRIYTSIFGDLYMHDLRYIISGRMSTSYSENHVATLMLHKLYWCLTENPAPPNIIYGV